MIVRIRSTSEKFRSRRLTFQVPLSQRSNAIGSVDLPYTAEPEHGLDIDL
jgi:hypothetical protein